MKEFVLLIRNEGNPVASLSQEKQQEHIQKVGIFINNLVATGKMKSALPFENQGVVIANQKGSFTEIPLSESAELISGYYHITARDLPEAIEIAKSDPRFEDGNWKIEVRPIMNVDGIS